MDRWPPSSHAQNLWEQSSDAGKIKRDWVPTKRVKVYCRQLRSKERSETCIEHEHGLQENHIDSHKGTERVSEPGHYSHMGLDSSRWWGCPLRCGALSCSPGPHPPGSRNSPRNSWKNPNCPERAQCPLGGHHHPADENLWNRYVGADRCKGLRSGIWRRRDTYKEAIPTIAVGPSVCYTWDPWEPKAAMSKPFLLGSGRLYLTDVWKKWVLSLLWRWRWRGWGTRSKISILSSI